MRSLFSLLATPCLLGAALAQGGAIDEGAEPNDFTGVPTFIGCGMRIDGTITASDTDYYGITVSVPSHIKAYTSRGRGQLVAWDTVIEIRDSADVKLVEGDDTGSGVWSYCGCNVTVPGLYYIVVKGFAAASVGNYALDVICEPVGAAEGAEPNNRPILGGTPTPAGVGMHAGFVDIGDTDTWVITHPGGDLVLTTGPSGPNTVPAGLSESIEDTIMDIYSAANVLLGTNDDDFEAKYSYLRLPGLAAGTYYVDIYEFDPTRAGYYQLRVGLNEPASLEGQIGPGIGMPGACASGCGTPVTLNIRSSNLTNNGTRHRPRIGTTFTLDMNGCPFPSLAVHVLGFSTPPPIDLAFLGSPGCFLSVAVDITSIGFADATGYCKVQQYLPDNPVFIGAPLHWQSGSFAACHNPGGIATTNVISGVLGNNASNVL